MDSGTIKACWYTGWFPDEDELELYFTSSSFPDALILRLMVTPPRLMPDRLVGMLSVELLTRAGLLATSPSAKVLLAQRMASGTKVICPSAKEFVRALVQASGSLAWGVGSQRM